MGLVVQPIVTAAVAFLTAPLVLLDRAGRHFTGGEPIGDPVAMAAGVAFAVGIVALLITLFGALPMAFWLVRRRPVSFTQALLFGLGFGNIPMLIGTLLTRAGYGLEGALRGSVLASLVGLAGAAAFWVIAIRGRDFSVGAGEP